MNAMPRLSRLPALYAAGAAMLISTTILSSVVWLFAGSATAIPAASTLVTQHQPAGQSGSFAG